MMKRTLGLSLAVTLSASFLAACGSDGDEGGDGPVTLNVATVNNPQMKDMESLKSEYEAANPDVEGRTSR